MAQPLQANPRGDLSRAMIPTKAESPRVDRHDPAVQVAVLVFVAALGALPYIPFAHDQGSLQPFTSAFDEADQYMPLVEKYLSDPPALLADLTIPLTIDLAAEFGYKPKFLRSSEMDLAGDRNERLLSLLADVGASQYLSGPSASSYIDQDAFSEAGIELEFMSYEYPEYPQTPSAV